MTILTTRLGRGVVLVVAGVLAAAALMVTLGAAPAGSSGQDAGSRSGLERNKETVVAFYTLAFNEKQPALAVEKYVGPVYIQHNPLFEDGPEAFIEAVTAFTTQFPDVHVDIRTVIAEGDRVVTHSLITTGPDDLGTVAADIFRLEKGRIVEHWDVVQPFPEESANPHPMF
jgi:predicted SnoaL-like aldol condensation-catalyzing enzyme